MEKNIYWSICTNMGTQLRILNKKNPIQDMDGDKYIND